MQVLCTLSALWVIWASAWLCLKCAVSWSHTSSPAVIVFPPLPSISKSFEDRVLYLLQFKQRSNKKKVGPSDWTPTLYHSFPKLKGSPPHQYSTFIQSSGVLIILIGPGTWHCVLFKSTLILYITMINILVWTPSNSLVRSFRLFFLITHLIEFLVLENPISLGLCQDY